MDIIKAEETAKNIRIPVPGEEGKHTGHKIRTIIVSATKGIKALYCIDDKKIITYIFSKAKGWTLGKAKTWVNEHVKKEKRYEEQYVDQVEEFLKLVAIYEDGTTEIYLPNSPSFTLDKEIEEFTTGYKAPEDGTPTGYQCPHCKGKFVDTVKDCPYCKKSLDMNIKCSTCGTENGVSAHVCKPVDAEGVTRAGFKGTPGVECPYCKNIFDESGICPGCFAGLVTNSEKLKEKSPDYIDIVVDINKVDKQKQIIYGVFLVPEKADHDGDVIPVPNVEKVAHGFLIEYRTIDEKHEQIIKADIVESSIAWRDDLDYYGKKLKKGTWFGAIKVHDRDVWDKILSGEYKAFSVRVAGVREPIEKDG